MNRIIFLLALITYPVICIWANPIDKAEARLLAKECVGIDDTSDDNVPIAPYYVFSRGADKGFVIVSGDDTTAPILGYTEQGDFVWDELPDQLQQMLKAWGQAIGETQKAPRRVGPRRSVSERLESARRGVESFKEKWEDVAVMCQTHWHQSSPYNDLCPMNKEGTKRATTGCMATAASQIIYYFRKDNPAELQYDTPTYSYGFPVVESLPKGTPVEYDQMCLSGMGTAKQNHAVAVLMYAIGTSSYQTYGVSTGGQPDDCGKAMARQFLLNNDYRAKWNYTQQQWEDLIYKSLKAGSPMLYGATAKDKSGSHAVVLDGYQAKTGLYHFNFGWGGSGDGWYTVDDENGMNGYPYDQRGCMNFRPCKPNLEAKMVLPEIIIHKKNEIRVRVVNNGTLPYKGIKFWVNSERELPKESTIENTDLVIPVDSTKEFVFTYRPASERRKYLFVTDSNNNILDSCTIFKDSFVEENVIDSLNLDVTEQYFTNAGFDEDLTFQTDGTTKPLISTNTSMSDRSWAYIAADSSVYAKPKSTSAQNRPDGRKMDAVNGFIGQIRGWKYAGNYSFPKCEWLYLGSIPYELAKQSIPLGDDGSTYLAVPSRPAIASSKDNVGFAYFRAGWGEHAVYKQTVKLPCAKYRLEYYAININPTATNGKNLTKLTCRHEVLENETSFTDTVWTKHEIEFIPITDFTIEFGFEANGGAGSNPILCIDDIKLIKISEVNEIAILLDDCNFYLEQLNSIEDQLANYGGLTDEIEKAYNDLSSRTSSEDVEDIRILLQEIKNTIAQYEKAQKDVLELTNLLKRAEVLYYQTNYPGKENFDNAINQNKAMLNEGGSAEISEAINAIQKAIKEYCTSQVATRYNPADYSLYIQNPWFVEANGEPTANADGTYTFPNENNEDNPYTVGSAPIDGTSLGWYIGEGGGDQRLNWRQGRTCWTAWNYNFNTVSIAQDITDLPNGLYKVSADLITQSGMTTDQHTFAKSSLQSAASQPLAYGLWNESEMGIWTTLTTEQWVIVADGKLTIGALGTGSAETGAAGWFCATNFKLYYFGEATEEEIDAAMAATTNTLSGLSPAISIGRNASLSIGLTNRDELIACEFDLQLPDGITIAKDEDGDPIAMVSSRASKHSLAVSDQGNGLYHFLCYSGENKIFSGNEGELLSIELLCDGNMAVGTYQATIKNIIFSDVDKNKITPNDYTFDLEVIEAEPGDVNNDGEINVMDVVEMVAYIMGDGAEGFVFTAADLYPDGAINVMDLVNLVDLIMHPTASSNARGWTENGMSLSTMADGAVAVKVNNPEQYVASEFIVEVSAGQTLETVTADKHHRVTCSQLDDSHYKVMAYSSANSTFNSDALVQLHISGEGMVNVHDALLVDESRKGVAFAPAVGGYTTGINQMENGKLIIENSSVYDLQGKKRDTSRPYRHEVLIVNGKKQVVR